MMRDLGDLHAIRPEHVEIHERCVNWSLHVRDGPGGTAPQPMFRFYQPYLVPREPSGRPPIDTLDAIAIERAVSKLPERHAYALRWAYVFPWRSDQKVRRLLAVNHAALRELIHDARSMLRNRMR